MLSRIFNLRDRARITVLAVTVAAVLLAINIEIVGKEQIVRNGTTVLLRIVPLDPRSLLQGDYMALRYSLAADVASEAGQFELNDGIAVIELDEFNEAKFVSLYRDQPLQEGQHLLRYRKRGHSVRLGRSTARRDSARFASIRMEMPC